MLLPLVLVAALIGTLIVIYRQRRLLLALLMRLPPPSTAVTVERGLSIPMPDGVLLVADHYATESVSDAPTVLIRSPYGRNGRGSSYGRLLEFSAQRFAERGYHVLIQDVRGRFDSEGVFDPFLHEKDDGLATIDWLRQQAWFDGRVVLWGSSYLGIVQWLIAHEAAEVKAMMPILASSDPYEVLFPNGVFNYGLVTLWLSIFHVLDDVRDGPLLARLLSVLRIERHARSVRLHLPISTADEKLLGEQSVYYSRLEKNAEPDTRLWRRIGRMVDVNAVDAPVRLVGGWYDFFLPSLLKDYATLRDAGKQPYLTIGKWQHFSDVNGVVIGMREGLAWFDRHAKGQPNTLRACPVRIFVMGANEWRDLPDFPPPAHDSALFLSGENLTAEDPPECGQRHYTYDPADPTPALGGAQFTFDIIPVKDNRKLSKRTDVLTFTGDRLQSDLEIIGTPQVVLFVESTGESADFFARLCDVQPNGRSLNICDGLVRIPADANDGIHCVEIELFPTAYRFHTGHCLQLLIASAAHPRWFRNLGTAAPYVTATRMVPAQQTVYYGGDTPSRLLVPVIE